MIPTQTNTRYGAVDTKTLLKLRDSYNTMRLLDAVDAIDEIRSEINHVRETLMQLHGMAHDLINDAGSDGSAPDDPIWDIADDVVSTLSDWARSVDKVIATVEKLSKLQPNDDGEADADNYDDEDEEAEEEDIEDDDD